MEHAKIRKPWTEYLIHQQPTRPNSRPTARNRFYGRNKNYIIKDNKRGAQTLGYFTILQRWSRGRNLRGQGHKKNPRPRLRTDFSRPRTQGASVLPPKKKYPKFFFRRPPEKKILSKFSARILPISQVT